MRADALRIPAIVLGHGITQLGVLRALAHHRIPAYALSDQNDFVHYSRHFHPPPVRMGTLRPERLADILDALNLPEAVLMPCTDDWLRAAANLPGELKQRFPSSMPSPDVVEAMLDKWLFAELLQREGVPHPRTIFLDSLEQAEALPEEVFRGAFLKPRASLEFSRRYKAKAFATKNREEALQGLRRTFADGLVVMLQEYVPGKPENYFLLEAFVDRHGLASYMVLQRLRMNPPLFGNSCLLESVPLERVQSALDSLERLFARIQFRGMCDAEFKLDERDGQFKLIEINARPWWQVGLAEHCGFPICRMAYLDALQQEVRRVEGYRVGQRGVILSQDYKAYRRLARAGQMSFLPWLVSSLSAHDLVFRWSDPMPGVAQAMKLFKDKRHRPSGAPSKVPAPAAGAR